MIYDLASGTMSPDILATPKKVATEVMKRGDSPSAPNSCICANGEKILRWEIVHVDGAAFYVGFPAECFRIVVYCDACDRSAPVDRLKVPDGITVQQIMKVLCCSPCGSHDVSIRIVYTGTADLSAAGDVCQVRCVQVS